MLQEYSAALNLFIRWERGQLRGRDPATGRHITTFEDEPNQADRAKARIRELEEENQRLGGG